MKSATQLEAEMAFIRQRTESRERHYGENRLHGISSDALARYALGWSSKPAIGSFPYDPSDLAACFRTFSIAPLHLRAAMTPVLAEYVAHVSQRYPKVADWTVDVFDPKAAWERAS